MEKPSLVDASALRTLFHDCRQCGSCCKNYRKIYHHHPRTYRGFRCNMADSTFLDIFGRDATALLGIDAYGRPLK